VNIIGDHHARHFLSRREGCSIFQVRFDRLAATAVVEARSRRDNLETQIDSTLVFAADQQLTCTGVLSLIQDALKYARAGRNPEVRCNPTGKFALDKVENRCLKQPSDTAEESRNPLRTDGTPVEEPTDNSGPGLGRGFLYA
jgi:hypothetical protein